MLTCVHVVLLNELAIVQQRRISVVVITPDSESGNPSSNLGSVSLSYIVFLSFQQPFLLDMHD